MELVTQIVPVPSAVKKIPGRKSSASYELIFLATDLPSLGYQCFYVSKRRKETEIDSRKSKKNTHSWFKGSNVRKDLL